MKKGPTEQDPRYIVDQDTLKHLPAFHRAVAEVLIDRGDWVLRSEGGDQK